MVNSSIRILSDRVGTCALQNKTSKRENRRREKENEIEKQTEMKRKLYHKGSRDDGDADDDELYRL